MMAISDWLTIFFAVMIVVPVGFMIFTSNIIRAAYAFAFALLGMAAIYVLLNAELMAVVQILIYVGGVIVLLLFGIMLTRRIKVDAVESGHRDVALGAGFSMILFAMMVRWIGESRLAWKEPVESGDQVRQIGISFLTSQVVSFEVIAFLLLVALVGAAYLAKKSDSL